MKGTTNMCTRFVYNGKETIVGFNFDIDLSLPTCEKIIRNLVSFLIKNVR